MTDKTLDSHYKMSKKIAQLTKVIFHLHTKNEENSEFEKVIKSSYERELANINKENTAVINKYKEMTQANKGLELTQKIKDLQIKHDTEKLSTMREYESFKIVVEQREIKFKKEKEDQIEMLKKEIDSMKTKFENQLKDLSSINK